jgi:hypothetical protein
LPVTNNPEWSWHNIPVEILEQARNQLSGDGEVVSKWRQYLDNAISNNSFNLQHARDVINKERWFKENNGRCLWDIRPDWCEIYKDNN